MLKLKNRTAFLAMIAISELGQAILDQSDNGYNVIVGSSPGNLDLFTDYSTHPNKSVHIARINATSTAAGRYQLLHRYYDSYKASLNLPDFSPDSQDKIALQQIKECHAINDIDVGNFAAAVEKCKKIWASLPGAGYGQSEHTIDYLKAAYLNAGGTLAKA